VLTVTDPLGNIYAYTYTPVGKVATKTLRGWVGNPFAPSAPTDLVLDSYAYDPGGRLASVTDSMGRTTSSAYYDDNLLATVTATGARLNGSASPANVVLHSYTYDGAGNQTHDVANGGLTTTVSAWDAANRMTSQVTDPSGLDRVTTYGYDASNNVTSVVKTGTGSSGTEETDSTYDAGSYLTSQTVKDGSQSLVTTYTVDQRGLVTAQTDPRGNVTGAIAANYTTTKTYDPNGSVVAVTAPAIQVTSGGTTQSSAQPVRRRLHHLDDLRHRGEPVVGDRSARPHHQLLP
jgi:YD repeat-containing protein